jgi:pimeloyl-ACP methyl ester carboxylesterase
LDATRQLFVKVAETHGITGIDFAEPAGGSVTVRAGRFHYLDWGGKGVPIFFAHGGGQSAYTWDLVACQLRDRYRCLGMDFLSHGLSDRVDRQLGYAEQGEHIKAVVDALGLDDFVLVGMSMGGLASLTFAARYPYYLRALSIIDITPTLRVNRREDTYRFMATQEFESFEAALDWAAKLNPGRPRVHMEYSMAHALEQRPDGKWGWRNQRRTRARSESPDERAKRMAETEALWNEVPKVPCPTLVVHGELSNVTERPDAERLARLLPKGRVITIKGATHTVQGDQPKVLADELDRFLSEVI